MWQVIQSFFMHYFRAFREPARSQESFALIVPNDGLISGLLSSVWLLIVGSISHEARSLSAAPRSRGKCRDVETWRSQVKRSLELGLEASCWGRTQALKDN
ncbi:MAG: hypothetical protein AAFY15_16815 [Cyanobacteria bacterium J06648_11]